MSSGERLPLLEASALADELIDLLAETCVRYAVAGSIRRQERTCGDIELVAIPKRTTVPVRDMFGLEVGQEARSAFDDRCAELLEQGVFSKRLNKNGSPAWGSSLKWGMFRGFAIDLQCVTWETWGYWLLVRTGPADFSKRVVTDRRHGGMCPSDLQFRGGRLVRRASSEAFETPDEESIFAALGYRYIRPEQRLPSSVPPLIGGRTFAGSGPHHA